MNFLPARVDESMRGNAVSKGLLCLLAMLMSAAAVQAAAGEACQRLAFLGEVKGKESFVHALGMELAFRMEPTDMHGWQFEIGPAHLGKGEWAQYVYIVTPPYRSRAATALDTSYGTLAQEAFVKGQPSKFWFMLNRADAPRAKAALDRVLWPTTEKEEEQGLAVLRALPKGEGTFTVTDADIVPGTGTRDTLDPEHAFWGEIRRIAFSVELVVPQSFVPAAGLNASPAPCPDRKAWF
jgi:hypothetical protein